MILINSMYDKSQNISNECMQAVTLMADTQTSIEKVQKYANSSAAFRMQRFLKDLVNIKKYMMNTAVKSSQS